MGFYDALVTPICFVGLGCGHVYQPQCVGTNTAKAPNPANVFNAARDEHPQRTLHAEQKFVF